MARSRASATAETVKTAIGMLQNKLESKYPVELQLRALSVDTFALNLIRVDVLQQRMGVGTKVLQDLCAYADRQEKNIVLTVETKSPIQRLSKQKLLTFYKRFGFQKNRDLEYSYNLIRYPK